MNKLQLRRGSTTSRDVCDSKAPRTYVINACSTRYHSKRVRAAFRGCATWGMPHRETVIGSKSHCKHVSDDMSICKQMYMKSRLHCFEVKRAPITQKIGQSVPNGVRSRLVKFSTVGGPSFAVVVLRKHSKTPENQ